jgi:cell cycle checkpoint control protein RAD9A
MAPGVPDTTNESRLSIGPKALKDLIDHFPISKSARSDPQLVWTFEDTEVGLKSIESSIDSRGILSISFDACFADVKQGKASYRLS